MPSFCCPLDLGPKPAITRPFTGQRKLGDPSDLATAGVGASSLGVTTAACCEGSAFGAGVALAGVALGAAALAVDGVASGWAVLAVALDAVLGALLPAVALPPGMTMRSPIFSVAVGSMLLALARSATERP